MFKVAQQTWLKGQWNSICSIVSSGGVVHIKQLYPESYNAFFSTYLLC
jgi:aminopeptidase C